MNTRTKGVNMRNIQPKFFSVKEAAGLLGLAEVTIRVWLAQRRLEHVRMGRAVRIPVGEITRIIEQGTVPALAR